LSWRRCGAVDSFGFDKTGSRSALTLTHAGLEYRKSIE
jgi:hypothetical protein